MEKIRLKSTLEVERIVRRASEKTKKVMAKYLKQLNQHYKSKLQELANTTKGEVYFVLEQSIDCPVDHYPTVYICKPQDESKAKSEAYRILEGIKWYGVKIKVIPFKPKFKKGTIHYSPEGG
jgi:hypothetical protein